jgi:hypothetical protein
MLANLDMRDFDYFRKKNAEFEFINFSSMLNGTWMCHDDKEGVWVRK